ncbi:MAG: dienelactone hydrolase family protein [Proteobacteria bacterium]|nr:dienelactone hydrolase family protein [Pseudomonadota bacterium]
MLRILYSMIVVLVLTACATGVSFQNAKLGLSNDPTEKVDGLLAKPSGKGPFPAIVLLHTCGGVQPHVSEDWPAFLTKNGYAALTVDTFGSRNAGRCPDAYYLRGITMARDAYGALDYLAGRPDIDPDRIGVMGFSLGAMAIEEFAMEYVKSPGGRNFKAGIVVYGRCQVFSEPPFPVLEIIGDQDRNSFNCLQGPFPPRLTVEVIPGAHHAFDVSQFTTMRTVSGGHSAIYSWTATKKARELTRKFFAKHLAR